MSDLSLGAIGARGSGLGLPAVVALLGYAGVDVLDPAELEGLGCADARTDRIG